MTGTCYEIRVSGTLSETLLLAFPRFTAEVKNGDTCLVGSLPDQAALHGTLRQVEALRLQLLEVRRCPSRRPAPDLAAPREGKRRP